jgi:hypothetical protein
MGSRSEEFRDDVGGNSANGLSTDVLTSAGGEHDAVVKSSNNKSRSFIRASYRWVIAILNAIRQEPLNRSVVSTSIVRMN